MTDIINITDIMNITDIADIVRRSNFKYLLNLIALPMLYAFNRAES